MVSLGEELKRERELREISLKEISDATKISIRILEAIESNNFKVLPGGIFNRNFLRAYAEFIGIDAETVVRKYQLQYNGTDPQDLPITELLAGMRSQAIPQRNYIKLVATILIALVLVAAAVYFFLNRERFFPNRFQKEVSSLHQTVPSNQEKALTGRLPL
jgi:cytoskeletal protein RodZ